MTPWRSYEHSFGLATHTDALNMAFVINMLFTFLLPSTNLPRLICGAPRFRREEWLRSRSDKGTATADCASVVVMHMMLAHQNEENPRALSSG